MRIQFASDLHLEFPSNLRFLKENPFDVTGDVLILAGDIFYLNDTAKTELEFWDWASENYREVMLIPGNHEYYGGYNLTQRGDSWEWKFRHNVGYYQNRVLTIDDTDFILTTLWADIIDEAKDIAHVRLNDFRRISCGTSTLTPTMFCHQHRRCLDFLKRSVEQSTARNIVVVTHHAPSFQCLVSRATAMIAYAYATDLEQYICDSRINLWIHGHNHENRDVTIGNTLVTANHVGYVDFFHHLDFDGSRFIEL